MTFNPNNPLILQSDRTILLEVHNPLFEEVRDSISPFAELIKSPEHIHTYAITSLSLWNAASAGFSTDHILNCLEKYTKYAVPQNITEDIKDILSRYGKICLVPSEKKELFRLDITDPYLLEEIKHNKKLKHVLLEEIRGKGFLIHMKDRGNIKQILIRTGYPVKDMAGYTDGTELKIQLKNVTSSGKDFHLRDYQKGSVNSFYMANSPEGGHGVIVLPCGAGKTITGMAIMEKISSYTLIISTSTVAVHQWMSELLDKTDLTPGLIGEYTGNIKEIKPVTLTTYQILTHRKSKEEDFIHLGLFQKQNWGLIIYDEVHTLPAPVFRATAEIQSKRRLGLTATLVREDGLEEDVFSLVGPKKYDVPWKELESKGYIAQAYCYEIRVELSNKEKLEYAMADERNKFRIASENTKKLEIAEELIKNIPETRYLL